MKTKQLPIVQAIAQIKPDVVIIIEHETTTGKTILKSGNGKPLNSLLVAQLTISIGKANLDNYITQAAGIVSKESIERSATNPPHNFVPSPGDKDICGYCDFAKPLHTLSAPDPRYCTKHGVMQCLECFPPGSAQ